MINKIDKSYKTIGEVVKILNLKSRSGQKLPTHTIRFWEKEFKQIKPNIFSGRRRYYDIKAIDILKKIKYLLNAKAITIKRPNVSVKIGEDGLAAKFINAAGSILPVWLPIAPNP